MVKGEEATGDAFLDAWSWILGEGAVGARRKDVANLVGESRAVHDHGGVPLVGCEDVYGGV